MPCRTDEVWRHRLLADVVLTPDIKSAGERLAHSGFKPGKDSWRALLDTGATGCAVSPKVVRALKLSPMKTVSVMTAAGEQKTPIYRVNVHPIVAESGKHRVRHHMGVEVIEFSGDDSFDFILGMDLIMRGSLHISGKHFTFCI